MASTKNIKAAVMIVMKARMKRIIWRLVLQIIHDCPSAIVNAWNNMDKRVEPCPTKIYLCLNCKRISKAIGTDGRCGRCTPGAGF